MPHKYVAKEVIERLRNEVSKRETEIRRIRSISRRDKEGMDIFLERLKELLESAKIKKDTAMDGLMEEGRPQMSPDGTWKSAPLMESRVQERLALIFRGEEKALETVLEMFEKPDAAVDIFVEERDQLQKQLNEYEKLEQRDNPTSDQR